MTNREWRITLLCAVLIGLGLGLLSEVDVRIALGVGVISAGNLVIMKLEINRNL